MSSTVLSDEAIVAAAAIATVWFDSRRDVHTKPQVPPYVAAVVQKTSWPESRAAEAVRELLDSGVIMPEGTSPAIGWTTRTYPDLVSTDPRYATAIRRMEA